MSKKTSPEKIKWTVLFIVHAVLEKTRVYAERLFSELLQANIDPDNVQVFVLHDTYDYDNSTDVYANLYEIKWDKDLRINKKEKCEDLGKLNVTTVKVLSDVLEHVQIKTKESDEQWEEANYQKYKISRKFILVTWDHSNGFGFFDTAQSFVQINRSRKPDMLMVNELQKAIKDQLSKIELLLMMNCWMQSIEAGYQLRDVVEFLIGPETTFDFLGYDYISFISEISKNPDIKEENLVTKIINDIPEKFKRFEQSRQTEVSIDDMIIAATRPKYATRIKKIVDELAEVLMEKLNTDSKDDDLDNLKKILQARTACYEITEENIGTP